MFTVLLEELGQGGVKLERLATTYAAFIQSAFNPETNRFRNFLGFDRRWVEEVGSEDSQGRALRARDLRGPFAPIGPSVLGRAAL